MTEREEALVAVEKLNDILADHGLDDIAPFKFETYGWKNSGVLFMGVILWTEDDDPRKWLEKENRYEALDKFLWAEAKKIIDKITEIIGR